MSAWNNPANINYNITGEMNMNTSRYRHKARLERIARRARIFRRYQQRQQHIDDFKNKFLPQQIIYRGRHIKSKNNDVQLNIDVRNFIQYNDAYITNFAEAAGAISGTIDHRAHRIQQAICSYLTYTNDTANEGFTEFWQYPSETLALKYGDCEDGAILMATTMIAAGIPINRVRVFAGLVKTYDPQRPWGGHAYVVYLRDTNMTPVVLDWSYKPDPNVSIADKPSVYQNTDYGDVWFSFNNIQSWGGSAWRNTSNLMFESRQELENKSLNN